MLGRITCGIRIRHVLGSAGCVLLMYGAARTVQCVRGYTYPHQITVSVPAWITTECRQHVESVCQTARAASFPLFVSNLLKQCPYVTSVDVLCQGDYIEVTVDLDDPLFVLNKEYLLLTNNAVIPRSWYYDWRCKNIPHIIFDHDVSGGMDHIEVEAMKRYHDFLLHHEVQCMWFDKTDAILFVPEMPQWVIRCNGFNVPNQTILDQCKALYHLYITQKQKKKKKYRYHVCDIRFEKQIVLYADKEGRFDGFIVNA